MNLFNMKKSENADNVDIIEDFGTVSDVESSADPDEVVAQNGSLRMKVFHPEELKEAIKIAECLKAGQTVLLILDRISDDKARRMIDYFAGVLCAINGNIEHPDQRAFILAPSGVGVDDTF